jgi:hypothetical protein
MIDKLGTPDRHKFAKELQDVLHLARYYGLETELEESVDMYYQRIVDKGLEEPLPNSS